MASPWADRLFLPAWQWPAPFSQPPTGKVIEATQLLAEIRRNGVTHLVGVPDNGSRALYELAWNDPSIEVALVTREGEAFALAAGLHLGGRRPLLVLQNTGLLEAGDAFRGTTYNMGIPLVMVIGYRGYRSLEPGAERVDTAASFCEPTLKAWSIPYSMLRSSQDCALIGAAFELAASSSLPVAVLYPGELA